MDYITSLPFDGFAIGGSIGTNRDELYAMLDFVMPQLTRQRKPVHLLGMGDSVRYTTKHVPFGQAVCQTYFFFLARV
jgi:queuine tRNA-ribosyltransferase